jgi:uncharacterized protein YbjT (DUF2867 family)
MKIIVTGSLGHISKPLTDELVQKGHSVTVVSSNPEKQKDIEALGATAAIGSLEDVDFITGIFTGADAVYTMVPPANYFDHNLNLTAYTHRMGSNYAQAIEASGVKRVVHLSSIGAHMEKGSGIIAAHHDVEVTLNKLSDVAITFMRPTSFYYNLYGYVQMIKQAGIIAANYGGDDMIPWVSPVDIAAAIADELQTPLSGKKVRYVGSEELTGNETARIIGEAIGKPDLKWIVVGNAEVQAGLEGIGMQPAIAAGLVEMYGALHNGTFAEDYYNNRPAVMGKVKLKDFAQEFAASFK